MNNLSFNNFDHISTTQNTICIYLIGYFILYIPLITLNLLIYNNLIEANNLINTPENIDYINKIKIIINDVCNIINCSTSLHY